MQTEFQNTLFTHDNLFVLHGMNSEIADLIYLDPPFNSKRTYSAPIGSKAAGSSFKDMWTWQDINEAYLETLAGNYPEMVKYIENVGEINGKAMMSYLLYMAQRIIELHRILKPTGSFYLHCDPTASHYLKLLLDCIFGKENFRNEIVWHYEKWTSPSKKQYQRNHDIVLHYSKSQTPFFNPQKNVTENLKYKYKKGYLIGGGAGSNGLIIYDKTSEKAQKLADSGKYVVRYEEPNGKPCSDVWQIPIINPMSKERTGYPTQKPLALLHRIIKASCPEGGVVLDPFCGCATTCVAAQQLGRKWVGIDIETKAVEVLVERLEGDGFIESDSQQGLKFKQKGVDFIHLTNAPQRTDVKIEEITPQTKNDIKKRLFKQQEGHCNGCNVELEIQHFEIDHIVPKAKGGGDYMENYQLLCGNCNRTKGVRPMEYLREKIRVRLSLMKNKVTFGE
jgi:site-specific DNA-methyltransferase (adenine-specific)